MKGRVKYNVMTDSELDLFKNRMEQLLICRGININHPEIKKNMADAGCRVEGDHIWFTKEVIDRAVSAVPSEFTLYGQDEAYNMHFPHPDGKFYTRTCTGAPFYLPVGEAKHYVDLDDCMEWYHLTNHLDNISYVALPSACAESVPANSIDVCTLEVALNISRKHIWIQPYETDNIKFLIEMCTEAAGGADQLREKPIVSFISCSVPILNFKYMDAEIIYQCAKAGIPVQPCALPAAGANTPVTAQGTALAACADVLAQIVMLETIHPGLPVIATPLLFAMDMLTTLTIQSSTETTYGRLICMQAFEQGYNIRCHSYGTGTDSYLLDGQNMIERTSLIQAMAMSDATVLGGAGQLETAMTINPLQLIIDDEIFGIAQRLRSGLAVDDETMDFEELLAGNDENGYLSSDHTLRHFKEIHREETFYKGRTNDPEDGDKTLLDRAYDKYCDILSQPVDQMLDPEKKSAINKIMHRAVNELENK